MAPPPPEDDDDAAAAGEAEEEDAMNAPFLRYRRPRGYRSPPFAAPYWRALADEEKAEKEAAVFAAAYRRLVAEKEEKAATCADEEKARTARGNEEEEEGEEGSSWLRGIALVMALQPPETRGKDEEVRLPCLAFPSLDGYRVYSLAEGCMCDDGDVRLRMACRRRYVSSPYGGKVFVTDLNWRYSSHLVDPFTGERTPLPDLPIPLSETEPMPCEHEEPRANSTVAVGTDDCFAWDWSPRGVMVARGDTVFFCEAAGGGGEWKPVHRSRSNSPMTINHRGGFFFVLERRSLLTTVFDAETLAPSAEIAPPPRRHCIDDAYLVASTDDVLLLVRRRAADSDIREVFTHAYRARHRCASPSWAPVTDIGDRAAFVTRTHGFTVGVVGPDPDADGGEEAAATVRRNRVYVIRGSTTRDQLDRRVVNHKIGVVHLKNPKPPKLLPLLQDELDGGCLHERKLGHPHWIIRRDQSSSGSVNQSEE
uniref:KIB1-4 beta-propeller domain-containing protein n=1 Tax=Oryza punctata TaxID=4537 RepID=A0A0E0LS52_ORYPU